MDLPWTPFSRCFLLLWCGWYWHLWLWVVMHVCIFIPKVQAWDVLLYWWFKCADLTYSPPEVPESHEYQAWPKVSNSQSNSDLFWNIANLLIVKNWFQSMYVDVCMFICICVCVLMCARQRTALDMGSQEVSTLLWETASLTWIWGTIIWLGQLASESPRDCLSLRL